MRLRSWLGFAAVLAIAAGSVIGALIVHSNDNANFERMQHEEAVRSAHQAQAVTALSVRQLATAAAFFETNRHLNHHDFVLLARSLLPGALSATAFVANVRSRHFPIVYAASKQHGRSPIGYDLASNPRHATVLRRARDAGKPAVTPIVSVLLEPGSGLVVYQPVYRDGAPTRTVAQRRAALLGFVAGVFRAPDLAAAATSAIPANVSVQVTQAGKPVIGLKQPLDDAASAPIHVADRTWFLVLRDPNRPDVSLPALIAVVGLSLAAVLAALILVWSRNERMEELQRQAGQDSLTGLKNRRRFEEDLRSEMARSRRMGRTGALLMLDLDHFKRVNDSLGHPAGDRVIKEIAGVLRRRARETDVLARLGGDEFAIVLPQCDTEEARVVAEAIATAIRENVPAQDGGPPVTASIGIAMFGVEPQTSFESVVSEADTAMYAAKDAGRDEVRVFDPIAVRGDA
ncbi:MAG TPA: diguanylate cyclase [Solirubrobacterales bacterium]|jgi:diguanylate cyclase (GGDEF)-like protein|nr:diguanylate cyclase [Solirubrobacterales bacterium]